jgi:hypothetical protein
MGGEIGQRRVELFAGQRIAAGADHLAAEAEAAIDRAGMDELEQGTVGIAMHHALDRRMGLVADRIGQFLRQA